MKYNWPVYKLLLIVFLSFAVKGTFASLDLIELSDDQICTLAIDPPLPAKVISEIRVRDIICNKGVAFKKSDISISIDSERFIRLKKWNRMLRGKRAIYSSRSGARLKINTIGAEKSITFDKVF